MKLNALLMCRDQHALRILAAILDELEIEQEVCHSAPQALELIAQQYYSALVVDFDVPAAAQVAHMARLTPAQRRPVVFAMIGAHADIALTLQSGANFVLYKPLAAEQVARSVRAGRGFMKPDRRNSPRRKVDSLVYLRFGDVCPMPAIVLDVSEHGLAVQAAEPLPAAQVPLRFILPGTPELIEGAGDVVWADETGRSGIVFTALTPASQKHLKDWIVKRTPHAATRRPAQRSRKSRVPAMATQ